jgi:hypothetical protein
MPSDLVLPAGLDAESMDIILECQQSTELFCKVFMPDRFWKPFSPMHRELFRLLDDDSIQRLAIAMFRGAGKTTLFDLAFPAKRILYRDSHYIIPVSASRDAAIEYSENLKNELLSNDMIRRTFGSIKARGEAYDRHDPFSTISWVTSNGVKVMPRGAGQQLRGRLHGKHRPDLFVIDDIEDDEAVESEERRYKLKRWFMSALRNSVEQGNPNWRIIVIGTVLHEDSLLNNLLNKDKYPDWHTVRFELCDDDYVSKWPSHMTTEQVKKLADEYRADGMLDVFYREYRNLPISIEDQGFKPENFCYYNDKVLNPELHRTEHDLNMDPNVVNVVLWDPARTMKRGSDETAVMAVAVDNSLDRWYVRDVVEGRMSVDDQMTCAFSMAERVNAMVMAPEVSGLNEYITYPITNEMIRRNKHYYLCEVKPRESKTGPRRSGGLVPLYRARRILHNKAVTGKLERLLLQWPRPETWHQIDCLSGMLFALEEGHQYFFPHDEYPTAEEYESIEYEPALVRNML